MLAWLAAAAAAVVVVVARQSGARRTAGYPPICPVVSYLSSQPHPAIRV